MIKKVKMYKAICDNCNKDWYDENNGWCAMTDKASLKTVLHEEGWLFQDNKTYCPDCWDYDDNNNIII